MQLPIPIETKLGNTFTEVELTKPRASVLADANKMLETGEIFLSIKTFLSGCIESFSGEEKSITDKADIKNMVNLLPYRSAEFCFYKILVLYDPENDAIEGIYRCPRCKSQIVTEYLKTDDLEIDTRDYLSDLDIKYMNGGEKGITLELSEPVVIKKKGSEDDVIDSIESLEFRHPTLADCLVAEKKYGVNDSIRMQFATYVEALLKVNGKEIDKKFKNNFGMFIFNNIKNARVDLTALNEKVQQYGLDPFLEKTCRKCNKQFKSPINMSNFFVSGLDL